MQNMRFSGQGQRRRPRIRLILSIAAGLAVSLVVIGAIISAINTESAVPPLPTTTPNPNQPPMVFTYFYYWYDLPDGPHSEELTDRPAEPHASYLDVDWFKKQFADMRDAGIDVALAVYWGPAEPSSDVGLTNMAQAADELRQEGRYSWATAAQQTMKVYEHAAGLRLQMAVADPMSQGRR